MVQPPTDVPMRYSKGLTERSSQRPHLRCDLSVLAANTLPWLISVLVRS